MENKTRYYMVKSKPLAYTLKYVTGQNFYKYTDEKGNEIYSFIHDDSLRLALSEIKSIRQTTKKQK